MTRQALDQRQLKAEGKCTSCWKPAMEGYLRCRGCHRKRMKAQRKRKGYKTRYRNTFR